MENSLSVLIGYLNQNYQDVSEIKSKSSQMFSVLFSRDKEGREKFHIFYILSIKIKAYVKFSLKAYLCLKQFL
ncbi:MAG: hypothetical protein CMK59_14600 [Proteobacteria bacterium]|nr:hypothetical protein [Pseudomonadota bacterium]